MFKIITIPILSRITINIIKVNSKMRLLQKLSNLKKFEGISFSPDDIKATFGGSTSDYEECSVATDGGNDTERTLYRDGEVRCQETIYACQ